MTDFWAFAEKHLVLFELLATLAILLIIVEVLRAKKSQVEIDANTAVRWLNHEHALLLDVRDAKQFSEAHILNALSLPNASFEDVERKTHKSKSKPCIFVCDSSTQHSKTLKLAERLIKNGYRARILKGGITGWIKAELPIIKKESA